MTTFQALIPPGQLTSCGSILNTTQAVLLCNPKLLSSQHCLSLIFSSNPYPYSQSLELGKATEGVGQVILEGVCLQVSEKHTPLALCFRKTPYFHSCIFLDRYSSSHSELSTFRHQHSNIFLGMHPQRLSHQPFATATFW